MNILIPDEWLRQHVQTKATPKELKDCLSLCGPSIERINTVNGETIYDIEVTTNRIDMMSVRGIAREAAVILPEFGIEATLLPFESETTSVKASKEALDIEFKNDESLCYRLLALKISDINLTDSPDWLKKRLELVGQRPLNNIVDITNYVMWEVGHPIHVFDYDRLVKKKIIIRLGKKGEKLKTLDEKNHTLNGGEIVMDDGTGTLIDLPGIMGTSNTVVNEHTKNVLLFIENSDPVRIRRASMGLNIRTQAAVLNEKHPDSELALVALNRASQLTVEITGGTVTSALKDLYPKKPVYNKIKVSNTLIDQYIGSRVEEKRVTTILERLGCDVSVKTQKETIFEVIPPSLRADDLIIPEDVIEEVARIVGYHTITPHLPSNEPPAVVRDEELQWEEDIKIHLRDWGYTEIYDYSMISEQDLTNFSLKKEELYKLANPLLSDHAYLRPSLLPSMLKVMSQNTGIQDTLKLFELSHTYHKQEKNLPNEQSNLVVAYSGQQFLQAKGLAEALLNMMGIGFPKEFIQSNDPTFEKSQSLLLGDYGTVGMISSSIMETLDIHVPVTLLSLSISTMVKDAHPLHFYTPVPKHPPIIEDFSFIFNKEQYIAPVLEMIRHLHPYIHTVTLLDMYENKRTIKVTYLNPEKTLTVEEVKPIREKIIQHVARLFNAVLQGEEEHH